MTSQKQIEANRRNAHLGTGPKTPKGKAISRANATKHGLLSTQVLLPGESEEEFEELSGRLKEDLKPVGALETRLVDDIAADFWRLSRIRRIESGVLTWERYEIEYDRAQARARQCEDKLFPDMIGSTIVDQKNHDEALKTAAKARLLQEQELPTLGLAFLRDAARNNALSKVSRYEAAINRSLFRVLHEFQRLQAAREGGQVSVPVAVDVNLDMEPTALADGG